MPADARGRGFRALFFNTLALCALRNAVWNAVSADAERWDCFGSHLNLLLNWLPDLDVALLKSIVVFYKLIGYF
jgi:hypothetical protein